MLWSVWLCLLNFMVFLLIRQGFCGFCLTNKSLLVDWIAWNYCKLQCLPAHWKSLWSPRWKVLFFSNINDLLNPVLLLVLVLIRVIKTMPIGLCHCIYRMSLWKFKQQTVSERYNCWSNQNANTCLHGLMTTMGNPCTWYEVFFYPFLHWSAWASSQSWVNWLKSEWITQEAWRPVQGFCYLWGPPKLWHSDLNGTLAEWKSLKINTQSWRVLCLWNYFILKCLAIFHSFQNEIICFLWVWLKAICL